MVRTCISLTKEQEVELSKIAAELDRSQSWMVRLAVNEYLNRRYAAGKEKTELVTV